MVNIVTMQDTDVEFKDDYNDSFLHPTDASMMTIDEILSLVLLDFLPLEDVRAYAVEEIQYQKAHFETKLQAEVAREKKVFVLQSVALHIFLMNICTGVERQKEQQPRKTLN